jgi:hypothetical protein
MISAGKMALRLYNGLGTQWFPAIKMIEILPGMHAGIGTGGTGQRYGIAAKDLQGPLQFGLHRCGIGRDL